MDELLKNYAKKFEEPFPVRAYRGSEEDLEKEIKKCIKENRPFKPEYKKDTYY